MREGGQPAGTRIVDLTPRAAVTPLMPRNTPYEVGGMTGRTPTMGNYFSDPLLQGHVNFSQSAINRLMQPVTINPLLEQAIGALTKMSTQGAPRMDMSYLGPMQSAVQKRLAQIDQPGYSPAQQDILRTQVSDPLEAQRDAARQQIVQHFAAKGFTPDSGVVQQALIDSDRSFSQQRTTGERQLAIGEMQQDEARKQEAVQISQLLSQLGLSGSQADLQGQIAGRGQNASAAGALAGIGSDLQNEPIQRLLQAYGISSNLSQMPYQAQAAAQSALGAQLPVPQADPNAQLIQLLLGLSNQGEGVYQNQLANGDAFWGALGQALPGLLGSFGTLFNNKPKAGPSYPGATPPYVGEWPAEGV